MSVTAQALIKYGAMGGGLFWIVLGYLMYAGSMFIWTKALSKVDLNYAYPFTSLSYILSALSGWLFFNESISLIKFIGIIVISFGAVICALDFSKDEKASIR